MRAIHNFVLALFLFFISSSSTAGTLDLSGDWTLSMRVSFPQTGPEGEPDCIYMGQTEVAQDGDALSGVASYELTQGDAMCPPEIYAGFTGTLGEDFVVLGALMGPLGTATFNGYIALPRFGESISMDGDVVVTGGPFSGTSGTWAGLNGFTPAPEIPTLGMAGTALLVLLLLAAGWRTLRR